MNTRKLVQRIFDGEINSSRVILNDAVIWEIFQGNKRLYGEHDVHFGGATVILHRPSMKTQVHFTDVEDCANDLDNHFDNYDRLVELDRKTAEYLSSEIGAWGRSGT